MFMQEFVSQDGDTYTYRDAAEGNVTCLKCPPGTHLGKHCSPHDGRSSTICHPCQRGSFTSQLNVLSECSRCRAVSRHVTSCITRIILEIAHVYND